MGIKPTTFESLVRELTTTPLTQKKQAIAWHNLVYSKDYRVQTLLFLHYKTCEMSYHAGTLLYCTHLKDGVFTEVDEVLQFAFLTFLVNNVV